MLSKRFGVEIEMTGITRKEAAEAVQSVVGGEITYIGSYYDTYGVKTEDGRTWKVMYDGSIQTRQKVNGTLEIASSKYSVEVVTPILTYEADMESLQEVIRALRRAGAFTNGSCGIHVHVDGEGHTARTLRNFMAIIYARNDLFYDALAIPKSRARFCKKLEDELVARMRKAKPQTLNALADVWYADYEDEHRAQHYNHSRYHFLNLHSFFQGNHTVEIRGFNSTLHAGEVRAYVVFALALNHQALTQTCASFSKPQTQNQKFAMRTYLNRLGLVGDEFKAVRKHLTKNLSGSAAWRYGRTA